MMHGVMVRLVAGAAMEVILAYLGAPFYMQVFPLTLFAWVVYDVVAHTKIIKIQTPLDLPDDLKKQLEKHARKQLRDIEKQLKSGGKIKTKDEEKK